MDKSSFKEKLFADHKSLLWDISVIASAFIFCLLIGRFGVWGKVGNLGIVFSVFLILIFSIPTVFYLFYGFKHKEWFKYLSLVSISLVSITSVLIIQSVYYCSINGNTVINMNQELFIIGGTIITILLSSFLVFFSVKKTARESSKYAYYYAFVTSICLRFAHVVSVRYHIFQNDLGNFDEGGWGHTGYIYLIYKGINLLNINPLGHDQLYHPPFYHFLAAVYTKIEGTLGCDLTVNAPDVIQTLGLFISFLITLYLMKIMRKLGANDYGCIVSLAIMTCIHFVNQSAGLINNDSLLALLCIMAIYYCIQWAEDEKWKYIIGAALAIGLAVMTKLSAAILALPMSVFFIILLIKKRKKWKLIIGQYTCFALASLPIGLWHPVYNFIRFNVPLDYCPRIDESLGMKIYYEKWDYFFNFDGCFDSINPNLNCLVSEYIEHNIPVSLIKHAVVGEGFDYTLTWINERAAYANYNIMWVLCAVMIVASIWMLISKKFTLEVKILSVGAVVSYLAFLVKFVWAYPYTCTLNIRYVFVALLLGIAFVGLMLSNDKKWAKWATGILFLILTISGYAWSICVMMSL